MELKLYRGVWTAFWYDGPIRKRISLRTADVDEARRRVEDMVVELPSETVTDALEKYLAEKKHRARSYASMETAWRSLRPVFGHLRPSQITRDLCRNYARRRRASGVVDGTIIKDLGVLRAALKWAGFADGAVFDFPPAPPPRDRNITRQEYERLLAECKTAHLRLFVVLALSTAARASAIFDLTWNRVDFGRGLIRLSTGDAGRKGRATVPITAHARHELMAAQAVATTATVLEWRGASIRTVKGAFMKACARAGLADVTPHIMRHSAAVWMAEDDVPIPVIAQFLGHSDPRVTFRVYARYSPSYLKTASAALERRTGTVVPISSV